MKLIEFAKMHGLGNDFIVIDGISQDFPSHEIDIARLAHRHLGVGCDQILLLQKSLKADLLCKIYNADGSFAEQCGNGMRCVARFAHENKLIHKNTLSIETAAGIVSAIIHDYDSIEVAMGVPAFDPLLAPLYDLEIDATTVKLTALSLGNPHAIIKVDSLNHSPLTRLGAKISTHSLFPKGTNVGFMEIVNSEHVRLRTYERGVGETFACGSNACASVVAGILNFSLANKVKVELPFGELWVQWDGELKQVILTGPAASVFLGRFDLQYFLNHK